ncbi:MAG: glycosyltransferase family 2 protein [Patescibacteria group bacterium]|nr:glycosyltransferase family 2 protein [Patescibacteria group bacterium]
MKTNTFTKITFKHKPRRGFLSVIIPVFDDTEGLRTTLKSLSKQILAREKFEIIVASDGDHPAIRNVVAEFLGTRIVRILSLGIEFTCRGGIYSTMNEN